jgi:hypothetical protein
VISQRSRAAYLRRGVRAVFFDNRSNERYEFSDHKVEYTLDPFSNDDIFEADLINASEVGLCMLSPHRLTVGQEIILRDYMNYSSRTAVVIWTAAAEKTKGFDKSEQVLYKAGLRFTD